MKRPTWMRGLDPIAQKRGWLRWHKTRVRTLSCPACLITSSMPSRLDTASPAHKYHRFALFECQSCGTGHFPDLRPPEYEAEQSGDQASLKFYIEQGAGLITMFQPLMNLPHFPDCTSLEVGCGYGFSLHFVREALLWNGTGYDPSSLARAGAKELHLPMVPEYLHAQSSPKNGPFDIVYSSEVIEHVANPDQFLGPITKVLQDDGILKLTTPDIADMKESRSLDSLIPLISAGSHIVLFSKSGLETLLKRMGYGFISIYSSGGTLFATASKSREDLYAIEPVSHQCYVQYLFDQTQAFDKENPLFTGFAGRLLKEQVNDGDYEAARQTLDKLATNWNHQYGFDLQVPDEIVFADAHIEDFEKFARQFPFNLPGVLYHAGILALNLEQDVAKSIRCFDASAASFEMFQPACYRVNVIDLESMILAQLAQAMSIGLSAIEDPIAAAERLKTLRQSEILDECKIAVFNASLDVFSAAANTGEWDVARPLAKEVATELEALPMNNDRARSGAIGLALLALNDAFDRGTGLYWFKKALPGAPEKEPWLSMNDIWADHAVARGTELLVAGGRTALAKSEDTIRGGILARAAIPADMDVLVALGLIHQHTDPLAAILWFERAYQVAHGPIRQTLQSLIEDTRIQTFLHAVSNNEAKTAKQLRSHIEQSARNKSGPEAVWMALGLDDLNRRNDPVSAVFWLSKTKSLDGQKTCAIARQKIMDMLVSAAAEGRYEAMATLLEHVPKTIENPDVNFSLAMYYLNHGQQPDQAAVLFARAAEQATKGDLPQLARFHHALSLARAGKSEEAQKVSDLLYAKPDTGATLVDRQDELEAEINQGRA